MTEEEVKKEVEKIYALDTETYGALDHGDMAKSASLAREMDEIQIKLEAHTISLEEQEGVCIVLKDDQVWLRFSFEDWEWLV